MRKKPSDMNPELAVLIERAKKLPPMTPAQIREQRISFAFGQLMDCAASISKDEVAAIHDHIYCPAGVK